MDGLTNFSFIDQHVAGSAFPYEKINLDYFHSQGITHIITLTEELPLAFDYIEKNSFEHLHLPMSSSQMDADYIDRLIKFVKTAKNSGGKVVMHCQFGQERTGIGLAIYLIKSKGLTADEAIKQVQSKRPTSLQISASQRFLRLNF